MRIALVSTEVAGFHGGGIGTYVVEAGKALTAAGHEVWLVTGAPDRSRQAELRRHPAFTRVLFAEDAKTPREDVRFAFGRRALWFSQLAFDAHAGTRLRHQEQFGRAVPVPRPNQPIGAARGRRSGP